MNQRQRNDLDNYITGHYGEDQFRECQEEAEIEAEVERIRAWNDCEQAQALEFGSGLSWLIECQINSLANHLVRNRMQVDIARDAQHKRLVEAAKELSLHIWTDRFCPSHAACDTYRKFRAALKAEEEA